MNSSTALLQVCGNAVRKTACTFFLSCVTPRQVGFCCPSSHLLLVIIAYLHATAFTRQGMKHTIETSGWPVFAEVCRLDANKLSAAEREFQALEAAGIIRRSKVVLTLFIWRGGSWRPCGNYCRMNMTTVHGQYPLPFTYIDDHFLASRTLEESIQTSWSSSLPFCR
jgi:hypothetical protein